MQQQNANTHVFVDFQTILLIALHGYGPATGITSNIHSTKRSSAELQLSSQINENQHKKYTASSCHGTAAEFKL